MCPLPARRDVVFQCWPLLLLLAATLGPRGCSAAGPRGAVLATSTQTRVYSSQVETAYLEPVNCTLEFDGDVVDMGPHSFMKSDTTRILNFVQIRPSKYEFQVTSDINANVSIVLPPNTVRDTSGVYNDQATASFSYEFYIAPPSVTLQLEGYEGASTSRLDNVAYLVFNSTTAFDGQRFFNSSLVTLEPHYAIRSFQQVNDQVFKFKFDILLNDSINASHVECVDFPVLDGTEEDGVDDETNSTTSPPVGNASNDSNASPNGSANSPSNGSANSSANGSAVLVELANATTNVSTDASSDDSDFIYPPNNVTRYPCSLCPRSKLCASNTTYPPSRLKYLEFPLKVHLAAVPDLYLQRQELHMQYDTLWAEVSLDAPAYAKEPFFVTVRWTEPLSDLNVVVPSFGLTGPSVDVDLMLRNRTRISPREIRLLISPSTTGVLQILINGTQNSKDLAGNSNDFRRNSLSRTGDSKTVIYSAGPPLQGTVSFEYSKPAASHEYNPTPVASGTSLIAAPPSLRVSWNGFITAIKYDLWITWGQNMTTERKIGLQSQSIKFDEFPALLGVEYTVYVRAWNVWLQETTVSKVFVHPQIDIIADGTYPIVRLPDLLSQMQTTVSLHILLPDEGFMSLDPLKVLSVRSANRAAGDQDPCEANSKVLECTFMSFHIEVPDTKFVVFKKPVRLQFVFGPDGWVDSFFRPKLHYWESYTEEWRSVAATCPPEQVYDLWNQELRVYEVSLCHLSLFSVFASFAPPSPTQAPFEPPRPASYDDPALFLVLGGIVLASVLLCCVFYWACIHNPHTSPEKRALSYAEMGIRPVSERIPSRRPDAQAALAVRDEQRRRTPLGQRALPAPAPEPRALEGPANEDEVQEFLAPPSPSAVGTSSRAVGASWALEDVRAPPQRRTRPSESTDRNDAPTGGATSSSAAPASQIQPTLATAQGAGVDWSTVDEVSIEDFKAYATTIAKSLSRSHDAAQQQILRFMDEQFRSLREDRSAESSFDAFELRTGDDVERLAISISIRRKTDMFLVSYNSRVTAVKQPAPRLPHQASFCSDED